MENRRPELKIDTYGIKNALMNFIVPLVCSGISLALGALVIYPSYVNMPKLKAQLQEKQVLTDQLSTKVGVLNKLTDFKPVLEENLTLINRVLVSEANVPYLLNQIDQIARSSGLEMQRLNYGVSSAAENADGSQALTIVANLGAEGNYDQMIVFLESLEKASRLVDVSNYRYSLAGDLEAGTLSMSFLLVSPYLSVSSTAATDEPIQLDMTSSSFLNTISYIKQFRFYETAPSSEIVAIAEEKPVDELVKESEAKESAPSEQ